MNKEKCLLGMSKHYQNLLERFEKWAVDCTSFLNKETFCDNSFVSHDECFESLSTPVSDEVQRMTKECLEIIFSGFVVVSRRMLHDHLKGGKYSAITPELEKEAVTVSTTNADPERDFGMLDRLMRAKPKALDLVYEGVIMFRKNKTAKWRDQLSEENLGKAMECARKSKLQQRQLYIKNKKEIFKKKSLRLQNSMEEKQRKEKLLSTEKEKLVKQINEFGGLWDLNDIPIKLKKFQTEKDKKLALKVQLHFRQKVLGVRCNRSLFAMTSGGKAKDLLTIIENLKEVINWTNDGEPDENIDISQPVFVSPVVLEKEKAILKERASKATLKEAQKYQLNDNTTLTQSRKRGRKNDTIQQKTKKARECEVATVLSSVDELIGKVIDHYCFLEDEDESWNRGVVVEKSGTKFLVRYHVCPDKFYSRSLLQDFKEHHVKVVDLKPADLVGASVKHLLKDDDTGEEIWWDAEVVDIDLSSKNQENPVFFILYHTDEKEYESQICASIENEFFEITLMEDYLNNWLQIKSVDLTNDDISFDFEV